MDTLNQPPSPQPTAEQTPVPPKTPFHSKILLIALTVFTIIIILSTSYLLTSRTKPSSQLPPSAISPTASHPSPTPDPTANWKTFTLKNLSFKVPPELKAGYFGKDKVLIDPDSIPQPPQTYESISFSVSIDIESNLNTIKERERQRYKSPYSKSMQESERIVDGKNALIIKALIPPGYDVRDHTEITGYIQDGSTIYRFYSLDRSLSLEMQANYFDQILSTFKFLEQ